ncbi:MAG: hypothetical protein V4574_12640 [Pseudomonadota bacterium]
MSALIALSLAMAATSGPADARANDMFADCQMRARGVADAPAIRFAAIVAGPDFDRMVAGAASRETPDDEPRTDTYDPQRLLPFSHVMAPLVGWEWRADRHVTAITIDISDFRAMGPHQEIITSDDWGGLFTVTDIDPRRRRARATIDQYAESAMAAHTRGSERLYKAHYDGSCTLVMGRRAAAAFEKVDA